MITADAKSRKEKNLRMTNKIRIYYLKNLRFLRRA